MKIVFLGFASSFTPGMAYQDNMLCNQVIADGHDVVYLSNPEKFINGKIEEVGEEDVILSNGLHLIRLPYVDLRIKLLTKKLRLFRGVYSILEREKPDVIFCHNTQYSPIIDVAKFKKDHPKVKVYADTHAAEYNSGTNWISRNILHKVYYRFLFKKASTSFEKVFYIGESERKFAVDYYHVPESMLQFYPLGGNVLTDEEYLYKRNRIREALGLSSSIRLYGHAGKLTELKKTEDLLEAYRNVEDINSRLIIMGSIPDNRKELLMSAIEKDSRVKYLGWVDGDTLQDYLCACDLYCQPYDVSSIFQNAICNRCAIMTYPHDFYKESYDEGFILWEKGIEEMIDIFSKVAAGRIDIEMMKNKSKEFAEKWLDYKRQAAELY